MELIKALQHASIAERKNHKDLAKLLWPKSSKTTQEVNMSKLVNGKTKRVDPAWVPIICDFCKVDANFLFGIQIKK